MAELWPRGVPPPIALRREFQGLLGRARCRGQAGGNFAMARGPQTRAASSIWPNRNSARRWRLKTPFPARCMPNPPWTDSSQSALAGTSGALKPSSMQAAAHAIQGGIRWRNHAGTPLIGLPDPSGQNAVTGTVSRESRHVTFSKTLGPLKTLVLPQGPLFPFQLGTPFRGEVA